MSGSPSISPRRLTATAITSAVLVLGLIGVATALPSDSMPLFANADQECHRVTFVGSDADAATGTSTWTYDVRELACAQDLSHWVLEIPGCATIVDAAPEPYEEIRSGGEDDWKAVKWSTGTEFAEGEFTVTLAGDLVVGSVSAATVGPDAEGTRVPGPACSDPISSPTPSVDSTSALSSNIRGEAHGPEEAPASGNDQLVEIDCGDDATVEVSGNANTVLITGVCDELVVTGNDNHIVLASPTAVTDTGNGNTVEMPETAPPPPAPTTSTGVVEITDNGQTVAVDCTGRDVEIRGNDNAVTLTGACGTVTVTGNNNDVSLASATSVEDRGNDNSIS